jgi:DNA-binding response OmpR family regulator
MSKLRNLCRIFVVDDEVVVATTLCEILKREGFDICCFTDPLKALEAAYVKAPDFLIADVVMPGMSGIDLAIVVRETWPDCPLILFSGQLATSQLLEAARQGGHDFEVLTKPVSPSEIIAKVLRGLGLGIDSASH